MDKRPEALLYADLLDAGFAPTAQQIAAFLRKQHEAKAELLDALRGAMRWIPVYPKSAECIVGAKEAYEIAVRTARDAVAKHGDCK